MSRKVHSHELVHSECFAKSYEFFITSHNEVGTSFPSETIKIEVQGYLSIPRQSEFLHYNSTSIQLNFSIWNLDDCDSSSFVVEYKGVGENWIVASKSELSEIVHINELSPEKEYRVKLRIRSGPTEILKEYIVPISQVSSIVSDNLSSVYQNITTIIPVTIGVVIIASGSGVFLIVWWKRREYLHAEFEYKTHTPAMPIRIIHVC